MLKVLMKIVSSMKTCHSCEGRNPQYQADI